MDARDVYDRATTAVLEQIELYLTLCRKMPLSVCGEGLG
jgi:hypothetical protein